MNRFIWLDNEYVANLDAIAYFKVQSEQLVDVVFRENHHNLIQIEGNYAKSLVRVLEVALNADTQPETADLRVVMPRAIEPGRTNHRRTRLNP